MTHANYRLDYQGVAVGMNVGNGTFSKALNSRQYASDASSRIKLSNPVCAIGGEEVPLETLHDIGPPRTKYNAASALKRGAAKDVPGMQLCTPYIWTSPEFDFKTGC